MAVVSKWYSKISHINNTFPTPSQTTVALRYTILYHRDPPAAAGHLEIILLIMLPCRDFSIGAGVKWRKVIVFVGKRCCVNVYSAR